MTAVTEGPLCPEPTCKSPASCPGGCAQRGAETSTVPLVDEPTGLWAVVRHWSPESPDESEYLVKAPGQYGGPYWHPIGSEDGWSWAQVTGWQGRVFLVRNGVES